VRLLTTDEICERALRKIGATAIRSAGSREAEVAEAKYWLDMVVGHIGARKRTWWLVPATATFVLRPYVWAYDMNQILGPRQANNGIQSVVDVWIGSRGEGGVDAYPNTPGWQPARDDEGVGPRIEPNGLIRMGHVRRQEWEGIQVVDLPPLPGCGIPTLPPWWPPPPGTDLPPWWWGEGCGAPPWCAPGASPPWPPCPLDWTPPADFVPPDGCRPIICPPGVPPWQPSEPPLPFFHPAGRTQFGRPQFAYIDRGDKPKLFVSPCPDSRGPYTIRVLFQTYAPDFVSAEGNTRQGLLRDTWNLCIVTQLAHRIGNGPVRKLPADEVRDMKDEAASLLLDLEAYDDEEQAGPERIAYFDGIG
jgi:hypothetical protein